MTGFERDILKRVLANSDGTQHIDIDSVTDISQARALTDVWRKDPDTYRSKQSIPTRSLKNNVIKFWDKYINSNEDLS